MRNEIRSKITRPPIFSGRKFANLCSGKSASGRKKKFWFCIFVFVFITGYITTANAQNWSSVSCGTYHTIARKTDGTLWAWGYNWNGQLGLGDTTDRNTPTKVGTDTNWASVSCGAQHTLAIKTDGTLWAWGYNWNGQLGLGDTTERNTPTKVGTETNWSSVSCGVYHTLARKTDGTLWAWGANGDGQLGLGDTTDRYTPTKVGTDTNWSSVSCGVWHTIARKTDGTLWAWGANGNGQLGLGDNTSRNTPTQVTQVILSVNPTSLSFGEIVKGQSKTLSFTLTNTGGGTLTGNLTANQPWISVSPTSFSLGADEDKTISVTVSPTRDLSDKVTYTGTVSITSNGGNATVSISVIPTCAICYPEPISLSSSKELTFWGNGVPYGTIRIYTLTGELVKELRETEGKDRITYDLTNEDGQKIIRGIYLYTASNPKEPKGNRGKFTVVK